MQSAALALAQDFLTSFTRVGELRRHKRMSNTKLQLIAGGKRYLTHDWSLGGCRINGYRKKTVKPGDEIKGTIGRAGEKNAGPFTAIVVRVTETGDIGMRFEAIAADTFLSMSGDWCD